MEDDNHNDDDHYHEEGEEEESNTNRSSSSSTVGGSRWNPTKEQIEMLERIYSHEGVRTPSADQIQQITARLRVYGHIEGKNVFYWFQNHKARQRQKQRLDRCLAAANNNLNTPPNINHISRFLAPTNNNQHALPYHHYLPNHNHPAPNYGVNLNNNPTRPVFSGSHHHPAFHHNPFLPNPNAVICNPYYQVPQTSNVGYYSHPQNHYNAPAALNHDQAMMINKRPSPSSPSPSPSPKLSMGKTRVAGVPPGSTLTGYCAAMMMKSHPSSMDDDNQEMRTLNLFPVHPTGILEHKIRRNNNNSTNNSAANSCATSSSSDTNMNHFDDGNHHHHHHHDHDHQHPHFFDFFSSGHASSDNN